MAALFVSPLAAEQSESGKRVTTLNNEILRVYTRSVRDRDASSALRQQAEELLQQRLDALALLMEESPNEALSSALPPEVADAVARVFPESAARVERHGSLIGLLEIEVEDGEDLVRHEVIHRLRVGRGRVRVRFSGDTPNARAGSLLRVEGLLLGESMVAESAEITTEAAAALSCSPTGQQNIAVLKVKFPGTSPSLSNSSLTDWMFGSSGLTVNNFWKENSYGAAWADGDVYPAGGDSWYTLDREYTCSESDALRSAALAKANNDVNYANYQRVVIVFPKPSNGCSFAGRASIGCWVSTPDGNSVSYALQVLTSMGSQEKAVQLTTHEGGHTLGLYHSSTLDHGSEPLGPTNASGSVAEYGDRYSSMGFWNSGHYAASQKDQLGWLNAQSVNSSGSFVLKPFSSTSGARALAVKRGSTGSQVLWLEYRRQLGDFNAAPPDSPTNGALIHLGGSSQSMLLDFTPGTKSGGSTTPNDFLDAPLASGKTWSDPYSDLSISIGSATNSGLQVNVSYGAAPTCSRNPPTINVSPNSKSANYPTPASYTVSVKNNDSNACGSSSFTMSSNGLLNGQNTGEVSTVLNKQVLTIAAGATGTATLTAKPESLPPSLRNYLVRAVASRTSPSQSVNDDAGFTVVPPLQCVTAIPRISVSPSARTVDFPAGATYTLRVWNDDNEACENSTISLSAKALFNGQSTNEVAAVVSNPSLTIAPGANLARTITVTPSQAPSENRTYAIQGKAVRSNPSQTVTAQGSLTVIAPAPCERLLPSVNLGPASRSTEYPDPASFSLSVTNNDTEACSADSFSISVTVSGAASGSVGASTLNIAPGVTKTTTVVVTPTAHPNGTTGHNVQANVSRPSQLVTDSSSLQIIGEPVCAPAQATILMSPNSASREFPDPASYLVTITNNDSNTCGGSTFALTAEARFNGQTTNEVSTSVAAPSLTILPGASKTTTVTATPITQLADARPYGIWTRAFRSGQQGVLEAGAQFVVKPLPVEPPPVEPPPVVPPVEPPPVVPPVEPPPVVPPVEPPPVVPPVNPPPSTEEVNIEITVLGSRGSVELDPLGLLCDGDCTFSVDSEKWSPITLTAKPTGQYCVQKFEGCDASGGSCNLNVAQDYQITVEFARCSRGVRGGGSKNRVKRLFETTDATSTGRGRQRQ